MMAPAKDGLDVGILASDIKASLRFYKDLLGLKFVEERPVSNGTMHRLRFGDSDFKLIDPSMRPPQGPVPRWDRPRPGFAGRAARHWDRSGCSRGRSAR